MGLYAEHVFPRVMNVLMDNKQTAEIRSRVCAGLHGDVVEIGFGTGLNLTHLPPAVSRLRAVDPLEKGRDIAASRLASVQFPVEFSGLDGQHLPFPERSADPVLSTWTLCSIEDPLAAVREIGRVLKPAGAFHFAEHGRAPDQRVQKWQDRFNGVQRRVACGCNLNRDIAALVRDGGFEMQHLDAYYVKGHPKPLGWTFEGRATVA